MGNVVKQTLVLAEQPSPENSPITETSFGAESLEDGVYSITTTTRYNAAGQPLISVQKRLISEPSPTLESKSVFVCERGLTSTQWTEYSAGTKRLQYSTVPGSAITAETVKADGVVLSQKDTTGITTAATRPPAIQKDGSWYTYGWDLTKNICELYGPAGYIRTAYTYAPYGQATSTGDVEQSPRGFGGGLDKPRSEFAPKGRADNGVSASQPIQWSSEFNDTELGLVYYNYRHYNPMDGRWMGRDVLGEAISKNLMSAYGNYSLQYFDVIGLDLIKSNEDIFRKPYAAITYDGNLQLFALFLLSHYIYANGEDVVYNNAINFLHKSKELKSELNYVYKRVRKKEYQIGEHIFLHENKAVYSDFYEQSYILGRYYIKTQHNISCNGKSGSMLLIQLKYKGTASILPKSFYTIGKDTYKYEFDDFSSDAIDERHQI